MYIYTQIMKIQKILELKIFLIICNPHKIIEIYLYLGSKGLRLLSRMDFWTPCMSNDFYMNVQEDNAYFKIV